MPITGPASYPPTLTSFLAHWTLVNTELGGGNELVLVDGENRGNVDAMRTELDAARDRVTDLGVDRSQARAELVALMDALQGRLVEFNARVRADLPGSTFSRILPEAFNVRAEGVVREALRQMSRIWAKINTMSNPPTGLALPLSLLGGMSQAAFDTQRDLLRDAYRALSTADVDLREARETRNDLQDVIFALLKAYRLKVATRFPEGHALIESLPALRPAEGHTPDPVAAAAEWVPASTQAKVTWTASADADLQEYQVRAVPGDEYESEDEQILATIPAGASPLELLSAFGLNSPGQVVGYKVFVVLDTGNERGSEAVYVTRPV